MTNGVVGEPVDVTIGAHEAVSDPALESPFELTPAAAGSPDSALPALSIGACAALSAVIIVLLLQRLLMALAPDGPYNTASLGNTMTPGMAYDPSPS